MKSLFSRSNQRGMSIVEVLISMAVISGVLVSAFLVSQRSSSSVRDSQEHSEALQLLQGQVEHVRALALAQKEDTGGIFQEAPFCIDTTTAPFEPKPAADTVCKFQDRYHVSITFDDDTKIFRFTGTWEGVGGRKGSEVLSYRVFSGKLVQIETGGSVATVPGSPVGGTPVGGGPVAGAGGVNGFAEIDDGGNCNGVGQPNCSDPVPGGEYRYEVTFRNSSRNPDKSLVEGCTWDWGNGYVQNFGPTARECQEGARVSYTYPTLTNEQPYPDSCNHDTFKVILTMKIRGVPDDPQDDNYALIPYCGV